MKTPRKIEKDLNGIVKWQMAYNNYRKQYKLGDYLEDVIKHLKGKKLPRPDFEIGTSTDAFKKYLPNNPESETKQVINYQDIHKREKFILHLKFALLIHGHALETNDEGEPILITAKGEPLLTGDEEPYLKYTTAKKNPEKQSHELYNLYYWSSEKNIRRGTLKLCKNITNGLPVKGTAIFEITYENKPPLLINDAEYFEDAGTVYIRMQRKHQDGALIYSQIIFRRKEGTSDIYFATYSSASSNNRNPYAGLMILERKSDENGNANKYLDFYRYMVFKKRIQLEDDEQAFSFSELDNPKKKTHAFIRRWEKIKGATGIYKGFFVVPLKPSLEICLFSVENNGKVNIWTAAQDQSPYKGSLSLEFDGGYNSKAIIKADRMEPFDDYRLTVYLNIEEYNYKIKPEKLKCSDTNAAYGLYTCYRYKNGEPFASRFACFKIADTDSINKDELESFRTEHVKSYSLKTRTGVINAESVLKEFGLYNFFKNKSKGNICLGVHI